MTQPERLLSVDDVAAWLGVTPKFVRTHARELGARKVGSLLKFQASDVQAYLDRGRIAANDPAPTPITDERQRRRPALQHRSAIGAVTGRRYDATR